MPGNRKRLRLDGYDYSAPGAYFLTICSHRQKCSFGKVAGGSFLPNHLGRIVCGRWNHLPKVYSSIELDCFQLMPNHLHGILILNAPVQGDDAVNLSAAVRLFKAFSTREINKLRGMEGESVWQRGFYDRIIRPEEDLNDYRRYIMENPLKWELDKLNPVNRNKGRT